MSMILLGHTKREVECSVLRLLSDIATSSLVYKFVCSRLELCNAACEIDRDSQEVKR